MNICRICFSSNTREVINLGHIPLVNKFKTLLNEQDINYPLNIVYCKDCSNFQLAFCVDKNELYDNYLYITPQSEILDKHYKLIFDYIKQYLNVKNNDLSILEIGSNNGDFLRSLQGKFKRTLGVDPAKNIVKIANDSGVQTLCLYFDSNTAKKIKSDWGSANFVVARHCGAHNEDINFFIKGVHDILSDDGIFIMENLYGMDTFGKYDITQIYHEHMYYYTAKSVKTLFNNSNLDLIDLAYIDNIHNGSMIFFGAPKGSRSINSIVESTINNERDILTDKFLDEITTFTEKWKEQLIDLIKGLQKNNKSIWMYGCSAKASMIANLTKIDNYGVQYCADSTASKIGKFIPGSFIEIKSEQDAIKTAPDYFIITAWNYINEIIQKIRRRGNLTSQFIVPFPEPKIIC